MEKLNYSRLAAIASLYVFSIMFLWVSEFSPIDFYFSEIQWSLFGIIIFIIIFHLSGSRHIRPRILLVPAVIMIIWPALVMTLALLLMVNGYMQQIMNEK